jgi:hypothetical protein
MRRPAGRTALALALLGLLVVAAAFAAVQGSQQTGTAVVEAGSRPKLLLLTGLPLVFGERLSLDQPGSPVLQRLEERYRVEPISVARAEALRGNRLLLMAQPLAQPAERLVELDLWVRQGGHVLLLADPQLEWDSDLPLGDVRRPPPFFADTGLLLRWGLRLQPPAERGPAMRRLGGREIMTASPGRLLGRCAVSSDRLVARCSIGQGTATIIADADFLDVETLDGPTGANLDALLAELAALER